MKKDSLVITNGSSGIAAIRRAGIEAQVISWDDVLHEGPVPKQDSVELANTRAHFLSQNSEHSKEKIVSSLLDRNERLAQRQKGLPVYLCFEHDLYDQLQVVQILDFVNKLGNSDHTYLVQADDYLTELEPTFLASLFDQAVLLGQNEFDAASKFWSAFTSTEPYELARLEYEELRCLPYLHPSKERLLLFYPDVEDGLSLVERTILGILRDNGGTSMGELFSIYQGREEARFLGDLFFKTRLDWLVDEGLLTLSGASNRSSEVDEIRREWQREVSLGDLGQQVLAGENSLLEIGIRERWIGGVRLKSSSLWKWNRTSRQFIQ